MHFVEEAGGALHLVHDDPAGGRLGKDLAPELCRVALESEHGLGLEQVHHVGVDELMPDPGALSGSPRPEEEERSARAAEQTCKHRRQIYREDGVDVISKAVFLDQTVRGPCSSDPREVDEGRPADQHALFTANAISAPENAANVEASFRDELSILLKEGFGEDEIATGKASWAQQQQMSRDQDQALAARLLLLNRYGRTFAWDAGLEAKVQALTADDLLGAMRRHLDPSAMSFMKGGDFANSGR
jgi:hypothetical protein